MEPCGLVSSVDRPHRPSILKKLFQKALIALHLFPGSHSFQRNVRRIASEDPAPQSSAPSAHFSPWLRGTTCKGVI